MLYYKGFRHSKFPANMMKCKAVKAFAGLIHVCLRCKM